MNIYRVNKINNNRWQVQRLERDKTFRARLKWILWLEDPFEGWLPVGRAQRSYEQAHELMEKMP